MTLVHIRNALESAHDNLLPAMDTVHQGESYTPTIGTPYAELFLLVATPSNPTMGDGFYQELGVFQVTLHYPAGEGTADIVTRGEAIRALFKRKSTFTAAGITVQIDNTPSLVVGEPNEVFIDAIVRAPWHADIFN